MYPPSSPHSPRSPTSTSRKVVFSKPEALRAPLRIKIPQPQLYSTSGTPQHARGSITLSQVTDCESESDDSSEDSSEPKTPRISISVIPPQSPGTAISNFSASPGGSMDRDDLGGIGVALGSFYISTPPASPSASEKFLQAIQRSPASKSPLARAQCHTVARTGPFQLLQTLNKGSYGTAYAARDLGSGQTLCTKVCYKNRAPPKLESRSSMSDSDETEAGDFVKGITTEMKAYRRIATASEKERKWLMELHGVLQDSDRVVFVMDLMQTDLFSVIASPIPKSVIRRWIAQIALGIDSLHNMGIIHRDIKPENILVTPGCNYAYVRIADYTNSWVSKDEEHASSSLTHNRKRVPLKWSRLYSRKYIGTKEYLAPEIRKQDWYGPPVDWWALGCLVYDLLVGDALFPDDRTYKFYDKWCREGRTTSSYLLYRANSLTETEVNLMAGLLEMDTTKRFRLEHLEKHPFFIEADPQTHAQTNVVDEMRSISTSVTRKRDRTWKDMAAMDVQPSLRDAPLCYASATPHDTSSPHAQHTRRHDSTFDRFAWINPSGPLAAGRQ